MNAEDTELMKMAIEEARKSTPEDGRIHPAVGVVVAQDGKILSSGHRGQKKGAHAEFFVLEEKLGGELLAGSTVYTTLEPCTTRKHPKVPCAQRLAERKVSRVVIGMLDPNPLIKGNGVILLREANIATEFFPSDLMAQVEDLNREFIRSHKQPRPRKEVDEEFVRSKRGRSLDEWYQVLNSVYWNRNFDRDQMLIFTHLVEVIGGLSLLASQKKKGELNPIAFVPKALGWWMALCGKVRIKSPEEMLWMKFPNVCPYCQHPEHDQFECGKKKAARSGPDWDELASIGDKEMHKRPKSLGGWQRMFLRIYTVSGTEDYGQSFARLAEELGELAETLRTFPAAPGAFISEASDVFAWLMRVQNIIELKTGIDKEDIGKSLENDFCRAYPDFCLDCGHSTCACPPILEETVGRITHEVPKIRGSFDLRRTFLTPDEALGLFQLGGAQRS